jgi:acyl-CoA thioester hydrolase
MELDGALVTPVEVRVAYGDVDRMGFAYYANYLRWFEMGRGAYLRARGKPYREVEADGLAMPVVEAYVRYRLPAAYDDLLEVRTSPRAVERVRVTFAYEVIRIEGSEEPGLLAEGHTVHACTGKGGRPRRFPPELLELLGSPPAACR